MTIDVLPTSGSHRCIADMTEQLVEDVERQIPLVKGFLFFYPTQQLYRLLNAPTALKHGYEEVRSPGWPTWRTFSKFLGSPAALKGMRPSTLAKMERMITDMPELEALLIDPEELEFIWQPYHDWSALIASRCLHGAVSKRYWQARVEMERQVVAQIRQALGAQEKLRVLLSCDLSSEPGCLLARQDAEGLLSIDPPSGSFDEYPELIRFRMCAFTSMLLRFAAWLVAEWEYLTDSQEARVPLEIFLPQFDSAAGAWNNPVSAFLDYMAFHAGCPQGRTTSAFLGKLWADHEYLSDGAVQGRGDDVASKQKLLRNWVGGVGGRPLHRSIQALTKAVAHEMADPEHHEFGVAAVGYAHALVFLETCSAVQHDMTVAGLPNIMILEVFSAFQLEYHKASQAIAEAMDTTEADK